MSALRIGSTIEIPGLSGRWSVWSKADAAPSAFFAVAVGGHTRGYATVKATMTKGSSKPTITLLDGPT